MKYQVTDNLTGKNYELNWEGKEPPTDEDLTNIFSQVPKQPEKAENESTSFGRNVLQDIKNVGTGLIAQVPESLKAVTGTGLDVLTGGQAERFGLPSGRKSIKELAPSSIEAKKEYEKRYGGIENIEKTAYEKPVSMALDIATLITGAKPFGKLMPKPKSTIELSKALPTTLTDRTLKNITTIPKLKEIAKEGFAPERLEATEEGFNKTLKEAHADIKKIGNDIYNKPQFKNAKVDIEKPTLMDIDGEKIVISPMQRMSDAIEEFKTTAATSDDLKNLKNAEDIWYKMANASKEGTLDLSTTKRFYKNIYDLSQKPELDYSTKKMFNEMYHSVVEARNSIPEMKNASSKYANLMRIEELVDDIAGGVETNAARKIMRRYKEAGNVEFNAKVDELADLIDKTPESKKLANLAEEIKTLQGITDITKAKAFKVKPPLVTKVPVVGKFFEGEISPETQARMYSTIKPDILDKPVPVSRFPVYRRGITQIGATKEAFIPNTIKYPKKTINTLSILNILQQGKKEQLNGNPISK